jgi:hypothetical protein
MATPIAQTVFDEERDRQISLEASNILEGLLSSNDKSTIKSSMLSFSEDEIDSATRPVTLPGRFPSERDSTTTRPFPNVPIHVVQDAAKNPQAGTTTPQSPIYSDWHRWIKAPNVVGGDLITQLEALRKHETEGLYTYEVCIDIILLLKNIK